MNRCDGSVQCDLCDKTAKFNVAAKAGWQWFTGYLPETFHVCDGCKVSQKEIVAAAFQKSRKRPCT